MDLSHQFGEMQTRLSSEGGFTYNPRSKQFITSGYSVAAHPAAEMRVAGGADIPHLQGFVMGSAPIWTQQKSKNRGQEMIGGWRSGDTDVLDIPKVFPANPQGHMKSRQAQLLRNQEASFALHEGREEINPFHPVNRGEVQAMDDPEHRATWAELPVHASRTARLAKRGQRQLDVNWKPPQEGESFL